MEAICSSPDCRVDGFLGTGHVCTITGSQDYHDFVKRDRLPVVVTGFEPVDLLQGILECMRMLESGTVSVANTYRRTASDLGNQAAQRLVSDVFEVCDRPWRGLGTIARGGLRFAQNLLGSMLNDASIPRYCQCLTPENVAVATYCEAASGRPNVPASARPVRPIVHSEPNGIDRGSLRGLLPIRGHSNNQFCEVSSMTHIEQSFVCPGYPVAMPGT